ncbi:MAG: hypothetical protein FWE07_08395 [Turicibacter sp.]|nr:hypothetical protein [Turicibacter sp.]
MNNLRKRIILLILGFTVIGSGVGMLRILDLGVDPFGVMIVGLSDLLGIGFGTVMMVLQSLIFMLMFIKKRELVGIGTIIGMFGLGYMIDTAYLLMSHFIYVEFTFALRLILLAVTLVILAFGVALTVVANLGLIPYEALGLVVEGMTSGKLKFTPVRMTADSVCALIGFLLGATLGVATLMTVFIIGPFVNFFKVRISQALKMDGKKQTKLKTQTI